MKVKAYVKPGHGVASGKAGDPRYPKGTIKAQTQHFKSRGLDLSSYFPGTVNVDISPYSFRIKSPKYFIEKVNWSEHITPENFYFFDVVVTYRQANYKGLIYMPDPATKEEHFQNPSVLELLLPKLEGLNYGASVFIEVAEAQLELFIES